jgi:hypothetical protein
MGHGKGGECSEHCEVTNQHHLVRKHLLVCLACDTRQEFVRDTMSRGIHVKNFAVVHAITLVRVQVQALGQD